MARSRRRRIEEEDEIEPLDPPPSPPSLQQTEQPASSPRTMFEGYNAKNVTALALLTLAFVVGEIARYLIGTISREMARDIGYGDFACYLNSTAAPNKTETDCSVFKTQESCESATDPTTGARFCQYLRNGQGFDYIILAGTLFIMCFTISAIIIGIFADKMSRTKLLSAFVMLFSISGVLMGFATEYWHLVVLRIGIAIGESACRPTSGSLIPELFEPSARGTANGVFNWGIYWGYGLTFTLGNYLAPADVLGYGWRSAFVIGCAPGIIVALLLLLVQDPRISRLQEAKRNEGTKAINDDVDDEAKPSQPQQEGFLNREKQYWKQVLRSLIQPAMVLLLLAATVRQAGGLTWAINTQLYLQQYYPNYNPGLWLTMCSIFGGSFGVFAGGFLSDLAVRKLGMHSRLWILAVSQFCATPLAVGVLNVEPPYTFVCLLIYYLFAETWFAVLFTIMVEIVPIEVRSVVVAIFVFLMNNIGGQIPLLLTPIKAAYSLRTALMVIWPGCILLCGIGFFISSIPLWIKHRSAAARAPKTSQQS